MNRGILAAIGAYGIWGILPIYWKLIHSVPAGQILAHRIAWSFLFLIALIVLRHDFPRFQNTFRNRQILVIYTLAAVLLSVNWLTYIWGVNSGFIVETSLGYFINPLISVLLGVVFLREKLRPFQWLPVGLATTGVFYLTFDYGRLPWIALVLALTFGLYGLVKKTAPLGSLHGLSLETAVLFVPAVFYLSWAEASGIGALGHSGLFVNSLLIFTGVVTALPLLLFSVAARSMNLSNLGILQYLAPTLQFLIGVVVYHEPFTVGRLVGFSIIWLALALFTGESILVYRRAHTVQTVG